MSRGHVKLCTSLIRVIEKGHLGDDEIALGAPFEFKICYKITTIRLYSTYLNRNRSHPHVLWSRCLRDIPVLQGTLKSRGKKSQEHLIEIVFNTWTQTEHGQTETSNLTNFWIGLLITATSLVTAHSLHGCTKLRVSKTPQQFKLFIYTAPQPPSD